MAMRKRYAAFAAVVLALGACTAPDATTDDSTLVQRAAEVRVAEDYEDAYDRKAFRHWTDPDGDGCNARDNALINAVINEGLSTDDCGSPMEGHWISPYDGLEFTFSSDLDIDHIIPLKEAWRSGAARWSAESREAFANDPDNLLAVSAASNRSKADKDPARWMPPREDYQCEYIELWIDLKIKWDLHADAAEHEHLKEWASKCPE